MKHSKEIYRVQVGTLENPIIILSVNKDIGPLYSVWEKGAKRYPDEEISIVQIQETSVLVRPPKL